MRVEPPTRTTCNCVRQCGYHNCQMSHFVNVLFVNLCILEYLLDGLHSLAEEIHVKLFKFSTSEHLWEGSDHKRWRQQ
jgi:hypothetical protein